MSSNSHFSSSFGQLGLDSEAGKLSGEYPEGYGVKGCQVHISMHVRGYSCSPALLGVRRFSNHEWVFCMTDGGRFDNDNPLIHRGARMANYVDGRSGGSRYESVIVPVDWRDVPKFV